MSFKIVGDKNNKAVILRGKFSDFKTYNELKQKLIDSSKTQKDKKLRISEKDVFILSFCEDKGKEKKNNEYIPPDLKDGFWNNKTFEYFKEKLAIRGIKDSGYRLYVNRSITKYPGWKKKQNHEVLVNALDDEWLTICNDIIAEVGLTKLEKSRVLYEKMKRELKENEKEIHKQKHLNIICNNCFEKDFKGKRFICAECNNYNLCQKCEKLFYQKQIHQREHTLIQVNKAVDKDDLYKYNNIIGNNNQEFKNVPSSFQIEISVINNGEKDLKNCYLLPIRYGDDYLTCIPKTITDEVQRNMTAKIILVIRVPHTNKGYFEGYFRMFSPQGLPFGNVLCVKVLNGE